jgi:hypothetical protein
MAMAIVFTWICFNIKEGQCFSQKKRNRLISHFFTQMQIKLVILTICASLATIGFAAPPPPGGKPADALGSIHDPVNSLLDGLSGGKSDRCKKAGLLGGVLICGLL